MFSRCDPAGDTHPAAPVSRDSAVWAASGVVKKRIPPALWVDIDCLPPFLAHRCLQKPCADVIFRSGVQFLQKSCSIAEVVFNTLQKSCSTGMP
jgi:hypothetical protein